MCEIDVTALVLDHDPSDFSASIAERGRNAAKETWENALAAPLFLAPEHLPAFRNYMRGFGAWADDKFDNWTLQECNALFVQLVAGDLRSMPAGDGPLGLEWEGNLYPGSDGRYYYYIGT